MFWYDSLCNDVCLTWIVVIGYFPQYDWLKVNVPLSMRNKLWMRLKDDEYEWEPKVVLLSMGEIYGVFSMHCIAQTCFEGAYEVFQLN